MEEFPFCLICDELIVDPVTLPCGHELCLNCFQSSINTANFNCCVCRKRFSSWARAHRSNPVNSVRKLELQNFYASLGSLRDVKLAAQLQKEENERDLSIRRFQSESEREELNVTEKEDIRSSPNEDHGETLKYNDEWTDFHSKRHAQIKCDEAMARSLLEEMERVGNSEDQIQEDFKLAVHLDKQLNSGKEKIESRKRKKSVAKSSSSNSSNVKLTKWFTPLQS